VDGKNYLDKIVDVPCLEEVLVDFYLLWLRMLNYQLDD
jgi:hypothetical protein